MESILILSTVHVPGSTRVIGIWPDITFLNLDPGRAWDILSRSSLRDDHWVKRLGFALTKAHHRSYLSIL